jgi:hypothetical protein
MFPITGITVVAGPPVGVAHIRLTRGLNLVYGVNGVGKSRTLDAIASVLTGWGGSGGTTPTDRCTRALYESGGVHFSAPISSLSSSDQAFRVLAECVGLGPDLAISISFSVEDDKDAKDNYEKAWNELDTETLRTQLAKAAFAEASWANPTIEECERLVEDGHWMITPNGDIFVSASASTTGSLDWLADNSDWNISIERLKEFGQFEWGTNQQDDGRQAEWGFANIGRNVRDRLPPHPYLLGMDCPEWLSIPVACVGGLARDYSIDDGPMPHPLEQLFSVGVEADPEARTKRFFDRDKQTRDWLKSRTLRFFGPKAIMTRISGQSIYLDANGGLTEQFRQALGEIGSSASSHLSEFFDEAPQLFVECSSVDRWFEGQQPIQWKARTSSGISISLNQLGSAHRRFADFAIQRALRTENWNLTSDSPNTSSIALIDEPERALHRLGETKVFEGLKNLADIVIAATHSPALIADSSVNLIHLAPTGSGLVSITSHIGGYAGSRDLSPSQIASELGITLSDLLSLLKVVVLVEGAHDELVVESMCPEIAQQADVRMLTLGGTKGIPGIAKSTFLIHMTDAQIVVATDNARQAWLKEVEARVIDRRNRGLNWRRELRDARDARATPEERLLLELLGSAIETNQESRVHYFGFSKPDIVKFMDPELICGDRFSTWSDVDQAFLSETGRQRFGSGDGEAIKKWVISHGGRYHTDGIAQALKELEAQWEDSGGVTAHRNSEFTDLGEMVQRLR